LSIISTGTLAAVRHRRHSPNSRSLTLLSPLPHYPIPFPSSHHRWPYPQEGTPPPTSFHILSHRSFSSHQSPSWFKIYILLLLSDSPWSSVSCGCRPQFPPAFSKHTTSVRSHLLWSMFINPPTLAIIRCRWSVDTTSPFITLTIFTQLFYLLNSNLQFKCAGCLLISTRSFTQAKEIARRQHCHLHCKWLNCRSLLYTETCDACHMAIPVVVAESRR
jgi:hypothetical protein